MEEVVEEAEELQTEAEEEEVTGPVEGMRYWRKEELKQRKLLQRTNLNFRP